MSGFDGENETSIPFHEEELRGGEAYNTWRTLEKTKKQEGCSLLRNKGFSIRAGEEQKGVSK